MTGTGTSVGAVALEMGGGLVGYIVELAIGAAWTRGKAGDAKGLGDGRWTADGEAAEAEPGMASAVGTRAMAGGGGSSASSGIADVVCRLVVKLKDYRDKRRVYVCRKYFDR